jgi:hypothetical protein
MSTYWMEIIWIITGITSVVPVALVARMFHVQQGLELAKRLTLPMGVLLTLLNIVPILSMMDDASRVNSLLLESVLPILFAGIQYTLLQNLQPPKPLEVFIPKNRLHIAFGILMVGLIGFTQALPSILNMIHVQTILVMCLGVDILNRLYQKLLPKTDVGIGMLALQIATMNALYSMTQIIVQWDDPSAVGPHTASLLLGFLYGFVVFMYDNIHHFHSQPSIKENHHTQPSIQAIVFGSLFICFTPILLFNNAMLMGDSDRNIEQIQHDIEVQQTLLRRLATSKIDSQSTLTVSSDKPAWIFIDDKFVSSSPLFQQTLASGSYTVKIASCPTVFLMDSTQQISWEEYWMLASDGTCQYPSGGEVQALIDEGLATAHVQGPSSTDDDSVYVLSDIEYDSTLNFCCDEQSTKEFVVHIQETALVYDWSFAESQWMNATPKK